MKDRSIVERGIKDTNAILEDLTPKEKKLFNKVKRSLIKSFVNPNHAVKMLIDVSALEYIRYYRTLLGCAKDKNHSRIARSIIDCLGELDLTPRAKKATEVTKTLSQIFQNLSEEK